MVKNSEITRLARENLRGKWSFMVLVALIYYVVIGGASFTFIGNCLISVAMGVGFSSISLKIARKQETQLGDLFSGFKIFLETFLLYLLLVIFVFLWSLLLIIPGIIALFSYSFVYLIAADEPDLLAMEIIAKSKKLTRGHKWQIFRLFWRFFGWFLLSCMTFGIGFLWSLPL